jgi:hypothetical protein
MADGNVDPDGTAGELPLACTPGLRGGRTRTSLAPSFTQHTRS